MRVIVTSTDSVQIAIFGFALELSPKKVDVFLKDLYATLDTKEHMYQDADVYPTFIEAVKETFMYS
jgi:hypothetical protein